MKILFTSVSAHGHLLPMAPLMEAALESGHEVAVMVSDGLRDLVLAELPADVVFLPAGPMPLQLATEAARRTGDDVMQPSVTGIGETFGGVLLDLSVEQAVPAAREWGAEAVVADMYSTLGEFLGAALGVPWYRFVMSVPMPPEWSAAIRSARGLRLEQHGLTPVPPAGTFDVWPAELADDDQTSHYPSTVRVRAEPHGHRSHRTLRPAAPVGGPPRVLVTLGTTFSDTALLSRFVEEVASTGAEVVATRGMLLGVTDTVEAPPTHPGVTWVPFTPIDSLLDGVSVVVSVGGAGTVLAALSQGVPLVLWPQGADQSRIAAAVAAASAGVVLSSSDDLSAAVTSVLSDTRYRDGARAVAAGTAAAASPAEAVERFF